MLAKLPKTVKHCDVLYIVKSEGDSCLSPSYVRVKHG